MNSLLEGPVLAGDLGPSIKSALVTKIVFNDIFHRLLLFFKHGQCNVVKEAKREW